MKKSGRLDRKYIYYVSTLNGHSYRWCPSERRWVALDDLIPGTEVRLHRRCRTMRSALRWSSKLLRLGVPGACVQIDRHGPGIFRRWSLSGERECGASV